MTSARDLLVHIERDAVVPLHRQVFEAIRDSILHGRLHPGDPLPASRRLARQLDVSRTVVLGAYDQLLAEGYVETRRGSGTYVSEAVAQARPPVRRPPLRVSLGPAALATTSLVPAVADFRHGVPAYDAFPMERWQRSVTAALGRADANLLGYGPAEGVPELRREIARILRLTRAVPADEDQVLVTTGATQGLDLLARLTLDPGDVVVMEEPAHPVLRDLFTAAGATIVPVPVDEDGLRVNLIEPRLAQAGAGRARLVYVTPSHQLPTGAVMSLTRKLALLNWANAHEALVVEDDYDTEFWFEGPRISAMAGLDPDNVVYLGSFSKSMFPALRIGYAVLPDRYRERFVELKWMTDRLTPAVEQRALADFIGSGAYAKHISTMTGLYGRRRRALLDALDDTLGKQVTHGGVAAGLHVMVHIDDDRSDIDVAAACAGRGVQIYPISPYYLTAVPDDRPGFILGFAALRENTIREGIGVLAHVVTESHRIHDTRTEVTAAER